MSPLVIVLATFASVALLVLGVWSLVYDVFFRYRLLVGERIDDLFVDEGGSTASPLFHDLARLGTHAASARRSWRIELAEWLEQSGTGVKPGQLLLYCTVAGCAGGLLAWQLSAPWWTALLTLAACCVLPAWFVSSTRRRRISKLTCQLPHAFDAMSRAVRAGQTIPAALQLVADDFASPLSEEFTLCYQQQNLGMSQEASLRNLAQRTGIMELQIFVVALLVQTRTGGNLIELLEVLAETVRKRLKLQDRIKSLTSEGRLQAVVLILLPLAAFVAIYCLAPTYVACLLERPWLLAATATAQAAGALWIQSIVRMEV